MNINYCVYRNTSNLIMSDDEKYILQNVLNAGFNEQYVEILTKEQYDERKAIVPLTVLKERKVGELDMACNRTILGRFKATINDTEYEFGYDYESQSRFNGIGILFFANKINEITWTAYENGERVRIVLNQDNFDTVSLSTLQHQDYNIAKFNQLLQQVNSATTKEAVEAIVWDE